MTVKDDLFRLIKSLDKNEKRYFKQFAKLHVKGGQNAYIEVFDVIESQDKYDEDAVLSLFKGERFTRNFSQVKYALFGLILKTLRNYHHSNFEEINVNDLLSDMELLLHKRMYIQANKLADKFLKGKNNSHMPYDALKIIEIKRKAIFKLNESMATKEFAKDYMLQQRQKLEAFEKDSKIKDLHLQMFRMLRTTSYLQTGSKEKEEAENILKEIDSIAIAPGDIDHIIFQKQAHVFYQFMLGEISAAIPYTRDIVRDLEKVNKSTSRLRFMYVLNLANLVSILAHSDKKEMALKEFAKLKELCTNGESDSRYLADLYRGYNSLLSLFLMNGDIKEAMKLEEESMQRRDKFYLLPVSVVVSYYNILIWLYIHVKKWDEALALINYVLNEVRQNISEGNAVSIQLAYLVASYESGNYRGLATLAKAIRRHVRKIKRLDDSLNIFIKLFMTSPKALQKNDSAKHMKALKKKLLVLKEREKNVVFRMPEVYCWIESKVTGIPSSKILGRSHLVKDWKMKQAEH